MYRISLITRAIFISLATLAAIVLFDFEGGMLRSAYCQTVGTGVSDTRVKDVNHLGPSMNLYRVIITKNLFNPERTEKWKVNEVRPVNSQGIRRAAKLSAPGENMVLEGIIIFEDYRAALVRQGVGKSGSVKMVEVGDDLGSYKIISIEVEELTLKGVGGEKVLTLFNFDEPAQRRHTKTSVRPANLVPHRSK